MIREVSVGQGDDPSAVSPEAFLGMLMQQLVPLLLGAWSGSMIGALSHHALGQYDLPLPMTGDPAMLFVVHNVEAFGGEWSLPHDELRYALALREVVHRFKPNRVSALSCLICRARAASSAAAALQPADIRLGSHSLLGQH